MVTNWYLWEQDHKLYLCGDHETLRSELYDSHVGTTFTGSIWNFEQIRLKRVQFNSKTRQLRVIHREIFESRKGKSKKVQKRIVERVYQLDAIDKFFKDQEETWLTYLASEGGGEGGTSASEGSG